MHETPNSDFLYHLGLLAWLAGLAGWLGWLAGLAGLAEAEILDFSPVFIDLSSAPARDLVFYYVFLIVRVTKHFVKIQENTRAQTLDGPAEGSPRP